ncbi:MAG: nucleoside triphosphate pyrophosphatase [Planctomycetota bacterium]|nr:nucleoside triphosphate pyrophosphatase [Planctomycetota bacterium]MEC9048632.1 nucleoside triphosphate pyrophosphatase [Planctomycetota bacterium]
MPRLILASTSEYRRALLEQLGQPFEAAAPGVDESIAKAAGGPPRQIVELLALQKAEAVSAYQPEAVVIGSDQAAVLDGEILGKPGSEANAAAQLQRLSGRQHQLITAVAIVHPGGMARFTDVTNLVMRRLEDREIASYVRRDQPLDCAGSYKFESRGEALFARVETRDETAIMGLPLARLRTTLSDLGFACSTPSTQGVDSR